MKQLVLLLISLLFVSCDETNSVVGPDTSKSDASIISADKELSSSSDIDSIHRELLSPTSSSSIVSPFDTVPMSSIEQDDLGYRSEPMYYSLFHIKNPDYPIAITELGYNGKLYDSSNVKMFDMTISTVGASSFNKLTISVPDIGYDSISIYFQVNNSVRLIDGIGAINSTDCKYQIGSDVIGTVKCGLSFTITDVGECNYDYLDKYPFVALRPAMVSTKLDMKSNKISLPNGKFTTLDSIEYTYFNENGIKIGEPYACKWEL